MAIRGPYETTPPVERPRTLGERIRMVRMAWHWTQADLGSALKTDQTTVSSWERGRIYPSGPTLTAIAALLGCTPDALESGKGFRVSDPPPMPGQAPKVRQVELRDPGPGVAQLVDLKKGRSQAVESAEEAILKLIQATREGRAVWVVME